jgi:hypothetical protein
MDYTISMRTTLDVPDISAEDAADLADIAPTPRGKQVNVDFDTVEAVKVFIAQAKQWADTNGYVFARVAPSASVKIGGMPTRVSFQLKKTVKSETAEDATEEAK